MQRWVSEPSRSSMLVRPRCPGSPPVIESAKRNLATKDWKYVQNYADAKTAVVEEINARARGG